MRAFLITITIAASLICASQKPITSSPASRDKGICKSTNQIEISLTRAWHLMGNYETIWMAFDGSNWMAKKLRGSWATKQVKTTSIEPKVSFDTVFASLKRNNIFQLDDQDKLMLRGSVADGTDYTLTYKAGDTCRTYRFNNPEYYKQWNKDVSALDNYIDIIRVLFEEFTDRTGG